MLVKQESSEIQAEVKLDYTPTCVSSSASVVAVGADDGGVFVYALPGLSLAKKYTFNRGGVTAIAFSPDGSKIAVGDSNRSVLVIDATVNGDAGGALLVDTWVFHNARVTCLSWHSSGKHVVSGSLDTGLEVWSLERPMKHTAVKGAHLEAVNGVGWKGDKVVSVGQDGFVKTWEVTLP